MRPTGTEPPTRTSTTGHGPCPFRLPGIRSVRARILTWMLALVGLTLAVTTGGMALLIPMQMHERVDAELADEVSSYRTLAAHDPLLDGRPVTSVRDMLELASRICLRSNEHASLALLDGKPVDPIAAVTSNLTDDPRLIARAAAARQPVYGDDTIGGHTVRYIAVPVVMPGDPASGTLVVAAFPDAARVAMMHAVETDAALGFGALLLVAVVAWLAAGQLLTPLRALHETAQAISESDLTRRIEVRGRDEIAQLAATFNAMLDRLEDAFSTQRRFIDDAGHELRTPITIIRGHLELLADDPALQQQTVALVTDELDRMNRMVQDLFILTTARRPDFLHRQPIDVAEFVDEVYIKASTLGSRRWLLDEPLDPVPALMSVDRHRLTQALIQLAQNAVQHTEDGDRIWIGYRETAGMARIWVRDSGPGIATGDQVRIFERFCRSTPGRQSPGAGLGLAIVKAIVDAHGGRVTVSSRPGSGATFSVELPVRTDPPGRIVLPRTEPRICHAPV